MKHFSLFILLLFLIPQISKSQGFTFTPLGSNSVQIPYIQDSLQDVHISGIVKNTSSTPLNFRFARIYNGIPQDWTTQMCYDLCYAPVVDTISMPPDPPYTIAPGHEDTLFYISFIGESQNIGTAIVRMYNTDNPSLYVQDTFKVQIGSVGISNISTTVEDYNLSQNFPNPFNPATNIVFSLPKTERVTLKVFDILGHEIEILVNNELLSGGKYKVDFNASSLTSGTYFYTINTENFTETKKMTLIK